MGFSLLAASAAESGSARLSSRRELGWGREDAALERDADSPKGVADARGVVPFLGVAVVTSERIAPPGILESAAGLAPAVRQD